MINLMNMIFLMGKKRYLPKTKNPSDMLSNGFLLISSLFLLCLYLRCIY